MGAGWRDISDWGRVCTCGPLASPRGTPCGGASSRQAIDRAIPDDYLELTAFKYLDKRRRRVHNRIQ